MRDLLKAVDKAKKALSLISLDYPMFINLVLQTSIVENRELIGYAGVKPSLQGCIIEINPDKWESLSLKDSIDVILHEYWHIILKHCWVRLPNTFLDNLASDVEINQPPFLDSEFIRRESFTYEELNLPPRKSRETYYMLLSKGKSPNKRPVDDHSEWESLETRVSEMYWKEVARESLEYAKRKGLLPGQIIEEIEVRWKKRLTSLREIFRSETMKSIAESIKERQTRKKPNRRFPLFAGETEDFSPFIVVALDTSESISTQTLEEFLSVIKWMRKCSRLLLLQCDAEITEIKTIRNIPLSFKVKGRGGTNFKPVFEFVEKKLQNDIDLLVYFTDLEGEFPREAPPYKVLWLVERFTKEPPFGKVISLEESLGQRCI